MVHSSNTAYEILASIALPQLALRHNLLRSGPNGPVSVGYYKLIAARVILGPICTYSSNSLGKVVDGKR